MNDRQSTGASTATSAFDQSGSAVSADAQLPPPPSFTAFSGYKTATLDERYEELRAWYDAQIDALAEGAPGRWEALAKWRLAQMPGHIADPAHRSSQVDVQSANKIWEDRQRAESTVKTELLEKWISLSQQLIAEYESKLIVRA